MKIIVMRHGECEADVRKFCAGRADVPLTGLGHDQAEQAAQWIRKRYTLTKIYSSPLIRAWQTAQAVADAVVLPITELQDLLEFDNGLLKGVLISEVGHRFPVVPNLAAHEAVYEQETKLEFRLRAENVMSRVLHENQLNDEVLIITHGGMINQLFRAFMQLPVDYNVWITSGDTGIHEWVVLKEGRGITYLNSLEHLGFKHF